MGELSDYTDAYLAYHGATAESVAYVASVVDKFDFLVHLALERALESLATPPLPANVLLLHPPAS